MVIEGSSIESMEEIQNQVAESSRQTNKNQDQKSQSTLFFLTTTPPASTCSERAAPKRKEEDKKEKERPNDGKYAEIQKSLTTDKLITLISHISSRLDQIEKSMGIGPN